MNNQLHEIYRKLWLSSIPKGVTCEGCGAKLPTHSDALNCMFVVNVGVPGHPALPSAQCPEMEHWACSIECWRNVSHDCIENHMVPLLQAGLNMVNGMPDTINTVKPGVQPKKNGTP